MRGSMVRARRVDREGSGALTAVACVLAAALLYLASVAAWGPGEELLEGSAETLAGRAHRTG